MLSRRQREIRRRNNTEIWLQTFAALWVVLTTAALIAAIFL